MNRVFFVLMSTLFLSLAESGTGSDSQDFRAAFERLKSLVGTWDVEGTEDRYVVYSLTGGNETLVEEIRGVGPMASFYHMDGQDLRVTHYCFAGNQPRLKAADYDDATGVLKFEFVDITNLSSPDAYHMRELQIRFLSEDRIELDLVGQREEKHSRLMTLKRRAP
ncbi:MAG TPA: hypothetical protein VEK15_24780 [Vicinamibacteria bacterium]|nr:hypothetical protein [Vicinamibacteria bacterium]